MILKHSYSGSPHVRVISAKDFTALGASGQERTVWNPANRHTAEVSDEAGQKLMDAEPGDWELVEGDSTGGGSSSISSESGEDDEEITDTGDASNPTSKRARRSSQS